MTIRGVTVLDFHGLSRRGPVDVVIEGNRVRRIAAAADAAARAAAPFTPAHAEEIDGRGCYLIAGLVSAHSHTAMTLLRGAAEDCRVEDWFNRHVWRYERNLTPDDVYWGSLLGAAEMLLAGVTCVADHYFHMAHAIGLSRRSAHRARILHGRCSAWGTDGSASATRPWILSRPTVTGTRACR